MRRIVKLSGLAAAALIGVILLAATHPRVRAEIRSRMNRHTIESRVADAQSRVEPLWRERCEHAAVMFPQRSVLLVGLKRERELRVYGWRDDGVPVLFAAYPFTAASGEIGPKLREGDRQVPEGIYAIESLNPNSRFHLSLRVNYPSDEDRRIAKEEGRANLGGDIMIHGGAASVGCIAIGDPAIEEVFWLVAQMKDVRGVEVLLCPSADPVREIADHTPAWVAARYRELAARLAELQSATP